LPSGCGGGGHTTISAAAPPPQTLQLLANQPPDSAGLGFLLTDGSVMFQGNRWFDWFKLTPDNSGSYLKGTWSQLANLSAGYAPADFACAVLADGRVVIVGGEYNFGSFALTNEGTIYDPVANTWAALAPPSWLGLCRRFAIRRASQRTTLDRKETRYVRGRIGSQHSSVDGDGIHGQERFRRRRRLHSFARRIDLDLRCQECSELRKIYSLDANMVFGG
jgi:hypothetical protein